MGGLAGPNQVSRKEAAMTQNIITIDDERIKSHLDWVVRGSVEETLNALLDAVADRLCNERRYEHSEACSDSPSSGSGLGHCRGREDGCWQ